MDREHFPYLLLMMTMVWFPPLTLMFSALVCFGAIVQLKDQQKGHGTVPSPVLVQAFFWGALIALTSLCMMWIQFMGNHLFG
jgi:hypothetical protein